MTKVLECKKCGRKNTFVDSDQNELCAVCEKEKPNKKSKKDTDNE